MISRYNKLQYKEWQMAPPLLATNESVFYMDIIYAAAMKNHMVDRLLIGYILIGGAHETA